MKIANYDKTTGKLLGWYSPEINGTYVPEVPAVLNMDGTVKTKAIPAYYDTSNIPKPNIEVSDADWQTAIDNGYNYVNATKKTLSKKDLRTFIQLQTAKISELTAAYSAANETDIAYMNTTFQASSKSQGLIAQNLSIGTVPSGFYWKDKANNKVAMTFSDLQGLGSAIQVRGMVNYDKLSTLKVQVNAATTQAGLDKITW